MIDRLQVWHVVGNHAPRDAASHDVEDRVDDLTLRVRARPTASDHVCLGDDCPDNLPFRIPQTAWLTRHAGFLPGPSRNARPNKCLEIFFRQALSGGFP
jgi:hypothetical protein